MVYQVVTGQSDTVVIVLAVLGFLTTMVTTVLATFVAIKTGQVAKATQQTHDLVNGMTGELRAAQAAQAGAEGFTAGEKAERDRVPQPSVSSEPQQVEVINVDPVPVIDKTPEP